MLPVVPSLVFSLCPVIGRRKVFRLRVGVALPCKTQIPCASVGAVTSSKLEAEAALAHLIACSERYAAAFPEEDGYRRPETLNEDVLGSDLWSAARVSTAAACAARHHYTGTLHCCYTESLPCAQSRKSLADTRHLADIGSKESLGASSSSSSEEDYRAGVGGPCLCCHTSCTGPTGCEGAAQCS